MELKVVFGSASGFAGTAAVTTAPGSTAGDRSSRVVPTYSPSAVWPGWCRIELSWFTALVNCVLLTAPMLVCVDPGTEIVGLGAPVIRSTAVPGPVATHSNCAPAALVFAADGLSCWIVYWSVRGSIVVSTSVPGVVVSRSAPETIT